MPWTPIKYFPDIVKEIYLLTDKRNRFHVAFIRRAIKEKTGLVRDQTVSNVVRTMIELEWIKEAAPQVYTYGERVYDSNIIEPFKPSEMKKE